LLGPKRTTAEEKATQFTEVIMTNPDLLFKTTWPRPRFSAYAATTMVTALFKESYGYELTYRQYGKPTIAAYDYAEKHARGLAKAQKMQISNFYMIGDNPKSDIEGANKKGWTSILVKTGVFDPNDTENSTNGNDKENPASYVVEDMKAAVELIYELEKLPKFTI
jgi:ribonucleotide monophosphatase NagD (HAD superfamily)